MLPRRRLGAHRHDRRAQVGPAGEAGEGDPRPAPRPRFRDVLRGRASPARAPRPPRPDRNDPPGAAWLRTVDAGHPLPNAGAHHPQGLVSCLCRLDTRVPVDFSLCARACERTAAPGHLHALEAGDVAVFGRGCFSFETLHAVIRTGARPVFRLQAGSAADFRDFMAGDGTETVVAASPGPDARRELARRRPGERFDPVDVRLVRCRTDGDDFNLATTLLDADVSAADLGALCHGRRGIEELYKVSRQAVAADEFHGRTERGVRQEPCARFNLIAMTRLLSGHGDDMRADMRAEGRERQTVNFSNAVAVVAANLEETLLAQADAVARAVTRMAEGILRVRARLRPGRSHPRKSMKPVSKWSRRRKAAA